MLELLLLILLNYETITAKKHHVPESQYVLLCETQADIFVLTHMWEHYGALGFRDAAVRLNNKTTNFGTPTCWGQEHPRFIAVTTVDQKLVPLEDGWKMHIYISTATSRTGVRYHTISTHPL